MSTSTLADRYGAPAPWRRRAVWAFSTLLAVAFLGWLAWTVWEHTHPPVRSELVSFDVQGEHRVTARIDVQLRDDSVKAQCLARAYAEDHTVVGELSFVPRAGAPQPLEVAIRTEREATSVQVVGCTAPGEPRPN
ncbi:DUF4307 domain-containing protein [Oryzihumus sp.]